MHLRAFRNSDPPALARVWNSQSAQRGLARNVTAGTLDQLVLSKPYFDRHGLIVAENHDGQIVGFVHAGFGPNEEATDMSTEMGVTCLLLVTPGEQLEGLADDLLAASEAYLRQRGSRVLYAGAIAPLNPFYLGLYGGSEMPGVLQSDTQAVERYLQHGYQVIDRCIVMHLHLTNYRPPMDRRLIHVKRRYRVEADSRFDPANWWEACTAPPTDLTQLELIPRDGGPPCGHVRYWLMEPLAHGWASHAAGIVHLTVDTDVHRLGLATYLNCEAIRHLQLARIPLVEVQTMIHNTAALGLYQKLGFRKVDEGLVMRKE